MGYSHLNGTISLEQQASVGEKLKAKWSGTVKNKAALEASIAV